MSEGWAVRASLAGAPSPELCLLSPASESLELSVVPFACNGVLLQLPLAEKGLARFGSSFYNGEHVFHGCQLGSTQCPQGHSACLCHVQTTFFQ